MQLKYNPKEHWIQQLDIAKSKLNNSKHLIRHERNSLMHRIKICEYHVQSLNNGCETNHDM